VVTSFGEELRGLRERHGLRQTDLVAIIPGHFARSTIANVESGREAPTPRLWEALETAFPDDTPRLEKSYAAARHHVESSRGVIGVSRNHADWWDRDFPLGGALVIDRRDVVVVFRESRAPEEVLQVIEVRARQDGVSSFRTKMWATQQEGFRARPEMLWGGEIVDSEYADHDGRTFLMREISFGRPLQRGERHTFALRSWVERALLPETGLELSPTHPTAFVGLHVAFLGAQPTSVWAYGPVPDEALAPTSAAEPGAMPTQRHGGGRHSAVFDRPEPGETYGIDWRWA
jgi:transcriptional regulator with XRE-family HTH domain